MNVQKCPIKIDGANGVKDRYMEIGLVFIKDDLDIKKPTAIFIENKDQVDHLIAVLLKLRCQIYGPDLKFDIEKLIHQC